MNKQQILGLIGCAFILGIILGGGAVNELIDYQIEKQECAEWKTFTGEAGDTYLFCDSYKINGGVIG